MCGTTSLSASAHSTSFGQPSAYRTRGAANHVTMMTTVRCGYQLTLYPSHHGPYTTSTSTTNNAAFAFTIAPPPPAFPS